MIALLATSACAPFYVFAVHRMTSRRSAIPALNSPASPLAPSSAVLARAPLAVDLLRSGPAALPSRAYCPFPIVTIFHCVPTVRAPTSSSCSRRRVASRSLPPFMLSSTLTHSAASHTARRSPPSSPSLSPAASAPTSSPSLTTSSPPSSLTPGCRHRLVEPPLVHRCLRRHPDLPLPCRRDARSRRPLSHRGPRPRIRPRRSRPAPQLPLREALPHPHHPLSPFSYAASVTTPVLILHCEYYTNVPVCQAMYFHLSLTQFVPSTNS